MTPRNVALARTFPILLGILVFGAIIVFLVLRTAGGIEQSQEVAGRFEGLVERCGANKDDGRQTMDDEGMVDGRLPGVAFRLVEGVWVYDATVLPAGWRAETADDVAVVLCLGPAEPLVTTACAVDESGAAPTRVYGEALTVRLVDAASGAVLAADVLQSAAVTGCRDEVEVARLGAEVIEGWVRQEAGE